MSENIQTRTRTLPCFRERWRSVQAGSPFTSGWCGRQKNLTEKALAQLRQRFADPTLSRRNDFRYNNAVPDTSQYRAHYATCIAGGAAHPAFTARFQDDLSTPGLRLPLTAGAPTFAAATALGRTVIWLHTFGERLADAGQGRPAGGNAGGPNRDRHLAATPRPHC